MAPKTEAEVEAIIAALRQPPTPGKPYGLPVPGSERPNRTATYRQFRFVDRPLLSTFDPELPSVYHLVEQAVERYEKRECLGWRRWDGATQKWSDSYDWMNFAEFGLRKNNFGAGIVELHDRIGAHNDAKYGVGILSQNRPEWQIADNGFMSQSLFSVALYPTLGPDTTEFIISNADLRCVVCSVNFIPLLIKLAPRLPNLKYIISMDPLDAGELKTHSKGALLNEFAAEHGIQIYTMPEVEEIGARSGRPHRPPGADDIMTINYTSGTTGNPKGVVLVHSNAIAAAAVSRYSKPKTKTDRHISYLPLAHIYGRLVDMVAIMEGACTGYFRGDIMGLVEDMQILQPTGLISVPRLFNRFNSAIRTATLEAPGVRGALSRRVIETKKANMKLPPGKASNTHFLYDKIWTPKVRAAVGLQNAACMVSGSALLDPEVQEFLRAAFGNVFIQGFGLTESFGTGCVQMINDLSTGNVGPCHPSTEICLESAPEFDYNVTDKPHPRGELLMRGTNIFKGYWKNEAETKKVLDDDGWFHTGDIAEVDSLGRFKIIDRKKNVLKLAQGEYISPERIENVYLANTALVNVAFVHGDAKESTLVAMFGVEPENFPPWASKILGREVKVGDVPAIKAAAAEPKVREEFIKVLDKIGKTHKFNSYERVRAVHLDVEPFTVENEIMTPTLKLKRQQAVKRYRDVLDTLYAEIKAAEPAGKSKL